MATPRDLRLYWLPFTLVVVNLAFGIAAMGIGRVVYFFILAGLIGFVEEVFFRGLILRAIAPRGLWKAALISSARVWPAALAQCPGRLRPDRHPTASGVCAGDRVWFCCRDPANGRALAVGDHPCPD